MSTPNNWQRFFDAHAPSYMRNGFTANTACEVDFLVEELALPAGAAILDIGCGTGRHSVELARRGYALTGIDLSPGMLAQAAVAAREAGVNVEWLQADATRFSLPARFAAAICLCEGAFGLLSQTDDPIAQPLAILSNVSRSLVPAGRMVLTALNGARMLRRYNNQDVAEGRFDPVGLVQSGHLAPVEGAVAIPTRERAFVPTELALLMRLAGLSVRHVWGGTAGNWGRRPMDLDEIEVMVVAEKTGAPLADAWPSTTG